MLDRDKVAQTNMAAMITLGLGLWTEYDGDASAEQTVERNIDAIADYSYRLADALIKRSQEAR